MVSSNVECCGMSQPLGSNAFAAGTIRKSPVGTNQLDSCSDVEGNDAVLICSHIFMKPVGQVDALLYLLS